MFGQTYLHILFIITTVFLPHLASAGTYNCDNQPPNGCRWTQQAWDGVYVLRKDACGTDLTATTKDRTINLDNGWAQSQVRIKPGYTNNHCWEITNNIIHSCFDSVQGKYAGSGTWCADSNCNRWYCIWMNPKYRQGCWNGRNCIAEKIGGGC
jgi:hypothetical protein